MFWLKLLLSLLLLGYLLWTLDLSAIVALLKSADWPLVLAAVATLIFGQIFSAVRWAWLARGLGLTVAVGRKIELYFLGMFLSLFLPSIIGGDVARGYLLARGRDNAGWPAAVSVIMERLNGLLGLGLVVSLSLCFIDLPEQWGVIFGWLWNAGLVAGFILIFTLPRWWPKLTASSFGNRFPGWKALPVASSAFHAVWWKSLPVSVLFQAMVVQAHLFLGLAVGLELSWFEYGFMVCLIAVASALPISFNGFGVREAGYIGIAAMFGAPTEATAAMAALWVIVLMIAALPGGIALWKLGGTRALQKQSESSS